MPIMQDYEIEAELTIRIRNVSASRVGGAEKIADYSVVTVENANSYSPGQSIPAATTRAIDELHAKVAHIARITQDHETRRLAK